MERALMGALKPSKTRLLRRDLGVSFGCLSS